MQRMPPFVEQVVQSCALLVKYLWRFPYFEGADRSNLKTLSTLIAVVDEVHEGVHDPFHRSQETFLLEAVIERTGADVRSGYMRTDGVESYVLFGQIFAI